MERIIHSASFIVIFCDYVFGLPLQTFKWTQIL